MKSGWLALAGLFFLSGSNTHVVQSVNPGQSSTRSSAVLVELFTSEGCSTCPPADKLLIDLDQTSVKNGVTLITLSEHVDYWNRLGWKDPFSSVLYSQRQEEYSRALKLDDVYTPQMIIDGRNAFVGSQRQTALQAIEKAADAPKANVQIAVEAPPGGSASVSIKIDNIPDTSRGDKAEVFLAVAESGLHSKVSRGENAGREIAHTAVARKLVKIGTVDGSSFTAQQNIKLDQAWKRSSTKVVVFLQERNSRRVLGAASAKLAKNFAKLAKTSSPYQIYSALHRLKSSLRGTIPS